MFFKRKCKITFIRNGSTINTEENRLFDDEKYPSLNANGKHEIEKIANWINEKELKFDKVYASSALRTVQSAEILSHICNSEFTVINNLNSRKHGIWSGFSYYEIKHKYPDMLNEYHNNPKDYSPFGGESIAQYNERIKEAIQNIVENNIYKRLIIITHDDVIQATIANCLEIPAKNQFKIYVPPASATQISFYEDFASLIYSGYIPS